MPTAMLLLAPLLAPQDCYQPAAGFGAWGVAWGPNAGTVSASAVYDDGRGPALYLGGEFELAGETAARSIARFDGQGFEDLPGPGGASVISASGSFGVSAMAVFDDGGGPELYVAADFQSGLGLPPHGIAKWDGTSWTPVVALSSPVASGAVARDLLVWDDGGGAALYFGGTFDEVDGHAAASIARYDGSGWAPLGSGYAGSFVMSLAVYDDGSGEQLYAGGFSVATGQCVQRWNGSSWSFLPGGFNAPVESLHVHDDGSGSALYAGGTFGTPFQSLVRWSGGGWSPVGSGVQFFPTAMETHDDGGGEQLYAIGRSYVMPPPGWEIRAARWDGVRWEYLQSGLSNDAYTLCEFDDGTGTALYAGGAFVQAGGQRADHVARWTAGGWDPIYVSGGFAGEAQALFAFDGGGGPELYADGGLLFAPAPGKSTSRPVRWSASTWEPLPGTFDGPILAFARFDAGSGPELYASGSFTEIDGSPAGSLARFDGGAWHEVGGGLTAGTLPGWVKAACVHDFGAGPRLVVAGSFDTAGGTSVENIAVWDGAGWNALAGGIQGDVFALASYDGGSGGRLYAGGDFVFASGAQVDHVTRWNGAAWEALDTGVNAAVHALAVGDVGAGPRLFVGGDFTVAGPASAQRFAVFDGSAWSTLGRGPGFNARVSAIAIHDQGEGPQVHAGGDFTQAGGVPARYVARWDGSAWLALEEEPSWGVLGLASFDDGQGVGPSLFAVGRWDRWSLPSGGSVASMCAAAIAPDAPCQPVPYCTAKVNSLGCKPFMFATGSTSLAANTLRLRAANVINNKSGLLFWSLAPNAAPFQGGVMCCQAPVERTPVQTSGGNPPPNDCSGQFAFHWNKSFVNSLGLAVGDWYYCQYWSRDPGAPSTTNLTDALRFLLTP